MSNAPLFLSLAISAVSLILFVLGGFSFISLVKGCMVLRRFSRTTAFEDGAILLKSPLVPAVSVVVVANQFKPEARQFVRRLIELHFGSHEVVLVLDGVTSDDFQRWVIDFHLSPSVRGSSGALPCAEIRGIYESRDPIHLVVVNKEPGGEADALNAGVNVAGSPVIALFDPDSEFEPTILLRLIRPLLEDPEQTLAVCGVAPPPAAATLAGRIGALEWLRIWLARCAAFSGWNILLPVPGSTVLVQRRAIIHAGGFCAGPVELILDLHGTARKSGKPYRIELVPEPVSCPRAPRSLSDLRAQAARDQRDLVLAWRNRKSIAQGEDAIRWGMPGLVSVRFLRPLLETAAWIMAAAGLALGWIDLWLAGVVLIATAGLGIVLSMGAVALRELSSYHGSDPGKLALLFLTTIPESLGYRQLRNLWLIGGLFTSKRV